MRRINNIKLYTEREVADLLEVGITTVANYRKNGLLKATRLGRCYYVPESALNEYLLGRIRFQEEKKEIGKQVTK